MIDEIDIYRGIKDTLQRYFPNIEVQIKDIKNQLRPSFRIVFVTSLNNQVAAKFEQNSIAIEIVYFSEKETLLDLLEVKSRLNRVFKKPIKVYHEPHFYIDVIKTSFAINEDDYILNCMMDINYIQQIAPLILYDKENNPVLDEKGLPVYDIDTENITDNKIYNRELLEQMKERIKNGRT